MIINTETQKQINRLTDTVNKILAANQQDAVDTPHLYEILLVRNIMLISEIEILMLTITLAKSKINNPSILNHNDLKIIFAEMLTEIPIVSIMEVASIIVFQSVDFLHLLIVYSNLVYVIISSSKCPNAHSNQQLSC